MNKVKIIVFVDSIKFINYLVYHEIEYTSLIKEKDYYKLVVSYEDYKKINRRYKCEIINYYGVLGIKYYINYHKYMIISFIFSMFLLHLLCNTIFDIKIYTDDENIKNKILVSLNNNGISINKRKKSFNEIKSIKEKILNENINDLEWIEIRENGSTYEVDVTKRVKVHEENDSLKTGSIYAKKDGLIKYITSSSGTRIRDINDYVKKGDVLISGYNFKDENIVSESLAKGIVFAETWYISKVSIPFKYEKIVKTGEKINHYYLSMFDKKFTLTGHFNGESEIENEKLIISKPYLFFKLYKETKVKTKKVIENLSEKEALELAIDESVKNIESKLSSEEYIISKKVLKKEVNSSKMYVEVFFKVYENIGVTSNLEKRKEENGKSNN